MMNMMMKVFSFFSILILFPIPFHFRYGIFSVLLDNELSYKGTKSSLANSLARRGFVRIITFPRLCDPAEHFYSIGSSKNFPIE